MVVVLVSEEEEGLYELLEGRGEGGRGEVSLGGVRVCFFVFFCFLFFVLFCFVLFLFCFWFLFY